MEFTLNLIPNQQSIYFVDQTMASYTDLYDLPSRKELCFVTHELVINAVEAMQNAQNNDTEKIEVHVLQTRKQVQITVTDHAGGLPEEDWQKVLKYNLEELTFSDRGRGLFFIKNMVDEMWFEYISETKFLVGVSKNIDI